ncbi:MAG: amino acid ABC transporter permease [Thermaerobacter sp.]|nr:MAG: amino acid ABC transporter permease [Bacillota bacterium]
MTRRRGPSTPAAARPAAAQERPDAATARPRAGAAGEAWRWLHRNLFSTWYNALLTVVGLAAVCGAASRVGRWALTAADWRVVTNNLTLLLVGPYPRDQLWRVGLAVLVTAALAGFTAAAAGGGRSGVLMRRAPALAWLLAPLAVLWLVHGDGAVLDVVRTDRWGGLLLTLMLAAVGIVVSFPFGVALALGRQSTLPVVRAVSTACIEVVRGVPLVTVLFSTQIMLTLFLPEGLRPDRVLRAMAGLVVFSAAYVAENVRGGLQSVPQGQIEAAAALGLNGAQTTFLIVLPQALRAVVPSLVGQFISLFKDTSLVTIVGLQELLGIANSVLANPDYLGRYAEMYAFAGLVYWLFCYGMSRAGRRVEQRLGLGRR